MRRERAPARASPLADGPGEPRRATHRGDEGEGKAPPGGDPARTSALAPGSGNASGREPSKKDRGEGGRRKQEGARLELDTNMK